MRHPIASELREFWLPYAFKTLPLSNHSKHLYLDMVSQFDLCKGATRENSSSVFGKSAS